MIGSELDLAVRIFLGALRGLHFGPADFAVFELYHGHGRLEMQRVARELRPGQQDDFRFALAVIRLAGLDMHQLCVRGFAAPIQRYLAVQMQLAR